MSDDGRFVITFSEDGDRHHVLHGGPWHFRNDDVILVAFDGDGNPADVRLYSIKLWAQIWGLLMPIKTVEMGYILGDKLGKVLTVAHRNKKIVDDDEYLRIQVEHLVDEPPRKAIDTTPVGSTIEISYDAKYEELPKNFLAWGLLGHSSARFYSIPMEIRKPAFSTDIKASTFWSTMQTSSGPGRRHFGLGVRQGDRDLRDSEKSELIKLPEKVVSVVATAVQK
ncbi:hypothetical protein ZWY2020_004086 [Hordeum vulgare]|nr:hypothetical protein ZWY2020_004086 [Hordeum vulgare]